MHRDPCHSQPQRVGQRLQQCRVVVDDEHARLVASEPRRDLLELIGAAPQRQLPVLHATVQRMLLNCAAQRLHEVVAIDRLLDEVVGSSAERLNRQRVPTVASNHQDRRVGAARPDFG